MEVTKSTTNQPLKYLNAMIPVQMAVVTRMIYTLVISTDSSHFHVQHEAKLNVLDGREAQLFWEGKEIQDASISAPKALDTAHIAQHTRLLLCPIDPIPSRL